ncbi:MAG: radical SAM protein [Candidatus Sericytochromatia bacterium]|nr:radical SAM protein [Candidatus Sericytochromatia bacterium]
MKVLLVNPPELPGHVSDRDKAGGLGVARPFRPTWRARYLPPTPAMDLLYGLALADRAGHEPHLVDAVAGRWGVEETLAAVRRAHPDRVGIRLSLPSLAEDLALANLVAREFPQASVFVFGQVIKTTCQTWLPRFEGDAAFHGELEAVLVPYLDGHPEAAVVRPGQPGEPPPAWAVVDNLDALPFPAWERVDRAAYAPGGRPEAFVYYLLTSRGCPKGCSMCPYYVHQGKAWRARSVESVMAEVEHLRKLGARLVQTRDPNISWRKPHLRAIADRLAGQTDLAITTETDLEALDAEDLKRLRDAGFRRIMTGVESVDVEILREIHQNDVALKRSIANMERCAELGIAVTGFFIVGSLHETWRTVRNTVETARRLPCAYSVSLMTPYHGTAMRDAFMAAGYHAEGPYRSYTGYSGLVRTHGLDHAEVRLAHAWAAAELELVTRTRQLEQARGLARVTAGLRWAVQRWRIRPLRAQVEAAEQAQGSPAPAPVEQRHA